MITAKTDFSSGATKGYQCTDAGLAANVGYVHSSGGYAAARSSRRRQLKRTLLAHEDDVLKQRDRDRVNSASLEQQRNFTVAAWGVRKHLDFIAEHNYNVQSGDKSLDADIEWLIANASEAENFDIRGRFDLQDSIRLWEAGRTVGGDMLIEKSRTGAKVQTIEFDRIRDPDKPMSPRWRNGVLQDRHGKSTHFAIHRRTKFGRFEFEKTIPADRCFHFGYFSRHDQARGISPVVAGLEKSQQADRSIDYALGNMLIQQLFGFYLKTDEPDKENSTIKFSEGPFLAELGTDEELGAVSSDNPSSNFDAFLRHVIGIVCKCLDLPYNFYDESHTNFFGSRAALILYLKSCRSKRRAVQRLLKAWTKWRLNYEISQGNLVIPRSISCDRIKHDWIPIGMPYWNPTQEATAASKLIDLGMTTRTELRRETHGDNWADVVPRQLAEEARILSEMGVTE